MFLRRRILTLLNKRKLEKLKDKWWKKNPERKDCDAENSQSDGISIQNIGGVFVVIFLGIIFACFTLAFEYWYYRHRTKTTKINRNSMTKSKVTQVKPLRFNLQPAPTHGFQNTHLRPRFWMFMTKKKKEKDIHESIDCVLQVWYTSISILIVIKYQIKTKRR